MNPLTHVYLALDILKKDSLTQDEKDHLIVGSIIPDISQFGLINVYRTHTQGLGFLQQTKNPLHYYFALGVVLHGEEPNGLDYHAHRKGGYIDLKRESVAKILKKYQKHVGRINDGLTHDIIEFSFDYLIAQRDPSLVKKVEIAFLNPKVQDTVFKFFRFFNIPKKKSKKINRYLNNKHLHHFFCNSQSLSGMADNWLNLRFYRYLKQDKYLPFTEKIKKLTKLSYYNLKRKIKNKNIIGMFEEISSHLEKDCQQFLFQAQEKLTQLKNELSANIAPQKG